MTREMEALVGKLEKRNDLIAKKLGGLYKTPDDFKKGWEIIAQELHTSGFLRNCNGSDIKKKWTDLKCRTKKKVSEIEKQNKRTGSGGSSTLFLTMLDQRVIALIKKICFKGAEPAKSHISAPAVKTTPSSSCVISQGGSIDESQPFREKPLCTSLVKQEVVEEIYTPGSVAEQYQGRVVSPGLLSSEGAQGYSTDIEASQSQSPTPHSECTDDQEYIIPDMDMEENSAEPGISPGIDASKRTKTPRFHFQRRHCLAKDEFNDFLDLKREKLQIMKEMLEVTKLTALEMQKLNKNYAETKSELKELNSTLKEIFRLKP